MQFSTESLISDACELIERVRYEAYGKARHGWPEDLDGSGSVTQADRDIAATCDAGATMGDTAYNVLVDLDFSGDLDSNEVARCEWSSNAAALDAGAISDPDFDEGPWSAAGYDGYIYDDIADLSCVRFRWYDAGLGRWMTRDPIGYVDGLALSAYSDSPVRESDPNGLSIRDDPMDRVRYRFPWLSWTAYQCRCRSRWYGNGCDCDFELWQCEELGGAISEALQDAAEAMDSLNGQQLNRSASLSWNVFCAAQFGGFGQVDGPDPERSAALAAAHRRAMDDAALLRALWEEGNCILWFPPQMDRGVCHTDLESLFFVIGAGPACNVGTRAVRLADEALMTRTVVHCTTKEGAAAILGSGSLRAGTFVAKGSSVKGCSRIGIMDALGIPYAKTEVVLRTGISRWRGLRIPSNGTTVPPITVEGWGGLAARCFGGAWQRQVPCNTPLRRVRLLDPARLVP